MSTLVRFLAWMLALVVVTLPVVAVLNGWIASDRWPLQRMQLTGEFRQVDEAQVREAILPHIGAGFFALELEGLRGALAELPWVAQVEVRKRWPDVLEVSLVEHRAWARWGEDRLLSDRGHVFSAPDAGSFQALPALSGPEPRIREVVAFYNRAQERFAGTGFRVVAVDLDARGGWSLRLDDGTDVVIGRADADARLARFTRLLPQLLAKEGRPLARADLRYTNGFALVWAAPGQARAPAQALPVGLPNVPRSPFPVPGLPT